MSADLHSSGESSFNSSVMRMSGYYNLPDFVPNVLNKSKIKHYLSLMQHKYVLHWQHTIQHSKTLEFYNTFKNAYTPSCYLELTSKLNKRKELLKFRIGNHKLMIEAGRYSQMPRVNRLCPTCGSNQIEDEIHLLGPGHKATVGARIGVQTCESTVSGFTLRDSGSTEPENEKLDLPTVKFYSKIHSRPAAHIFSAH